MSDLGKLPVPKTLFVAGGVGGQWETPQRLDVPAEIWGSLPDSLKESLKPAAPMEPPEPPIPPPVEPPRPGPPAPEPPTPPPPLEPDPLAHRLQLATAAAAAMHELVQLETTAPMANRLIVLTAMRDTLDTIAGAYRRLTSP